MDKFVEFVGKFFREEKMVVNKGNLPECFASIFVIRMKKEGFEVITYEQLVRLIQNHALWKNCQNKSQRSSRENAEKFLQEIGVL